jgi:hypothetical protein
MPPRRTSAPDIAVRDMTNLDESPWTTVQVLKDQLNKLAELSNTPTGRLMGIEDAPTAVAMAIDDLCEKIQHRVGDETGAPIQSLCISCHNIRDTTGSWRDLVSYYQQTSDMNLAWDICPACKEAQARNRLILSFFDVILGPSLLAIVPESAAFPEYAEMQGILDSQIEGFFMTVIEDHVFANYKFRVIFQEARGKHVLFVLSYATSTANKTFDQEFAREFLAAIVHQLRTEDTLTNLFLKIKKFGCVDRATLSEVPEYRKLNLTLKDNFLHLPEKNVGYFVETQVETRT